MSVFFFRNRLSNSTTYITNYSYIGGHFCFSCVLPVLPICYLAHIGMAPGNFLLFFKSQVPHRCKCAVSNFHLKLFTFLQTAKTIIYVPILYSFRLYILLIQAQGGHQFSFLFWRKTIGILKLGGKCFQICLKKFSRKIKK